MVMTVFMLMAVVMVVTVFMFMVMAVLGSVTVPSPAYRAGSLGYKR